MQAEPVIFPKRKVNLLSNVTLRNALEISFVQCFVFRLRQVGKASKGVNELTYRPDVCLRALFSTTNGTEAIAASKVVSYCNLPTPCGVAQPNGENVRIAHQRSLTLEEYTGNLRRQKRDVNGRTMEGALIAIDPNLNRPPIRGEILSSLRGGNEVNKVPFRHSSKAADEAPYCARYPPSTGSTTPVTNDASSEARKRIAFATSSG